jgi:probable HAF family extracellular repeat protein
MTNLGTLGGFFSEPNGINPKGQVVGASITAAGKPRAFLWAQGGMTDLGDGAATAINSAGQVVGWSDFGAAGVHATLWDKGVRRDLGTLGGDIS